MRALLRATILMSFAALLLSACAPGSQCACVDYTRFSIDYVGTPTQVEHAPSEAHHGAGQVRLSDSTHETVYTDSLLTATVDLYKDRLLLTLHNRTDDSLHFLVADARFIDANGRWPVAVHHDAAPSPAYGIAALAIPAGDTAATKLNPQIDGKGNWEPIFPPETVTIFDESRQYDRLSAASTETLRSTTDTWLQEHFGTTYGVHLPVTANGMSHQYTISFEIREAIIYGVSENVIAKASGDSLVISREPRGS
jgi:hypothetical protein